ncbi:uncharacterized protein BJ212DRAFT_1299128 [Suillus subaureus]|uniref:Uncharacterized protein n=1 Tax=Suillus subaureus TaxID=48587 RepID=A0A9P7ECQ3_9AGAM|nr:uncharacterized protein BJ212DRAFT_1299128 [Suillus subaureus]KAG1817587.1 hypothetical protein BJ212DRAFT_1299128 [Suillus subaureus]
MYVTRLNTHHRINHHHSISVYFMAISNNTSGKPPGPMTPTSGHWEWGNGPKPRPGSQKGARSAPFASCAEGTMGVKLVIDVADDTAMPFSSILEDLIIAEYGSLMDGMDPDNAGNPHALAAHMRMCQRMDICAKGLHNILAESFSLLATPTMPMDGLPLHEDTRSKLHEDAILSQERQRCTALAQAIYSAKSDLQMVWRIVELA